MTLIEELEQAAKDYEALCYDGDTCEGCCGHDQAARLRKRVERIRTLRGIDESLGAAGNLVIIDAIIGDLP